MYHEKWIAGVESGANEDSVSDGVDEQVVDPDAVVID
jgi:hypothetical protein